MRKLLLILVLAFFLVACTPQDSSSEQTGKEGVLLSIGQTPAQVYDQDRLVIPAELYNAGFSDAEVFVYISGLDPSFFTTTQSSERVVLQGKKSADLPGENSITEFEYELRPLKEGEKGADSFKTGFMATACYRYKTSFFTEACINPDPYARRFLVCSPSDESFSAGQGAPVAVTKLEVTPMKGKTLFKIYIENVGGGIVYDNNALQSCNPHMATTQQELDWVYLESATVHNSPMACKPLSDSRIKLYQGKGFVVCEFSEDVSAKPYTSQLSLVLSYAYGTSLKRNIEVLATP